MAYSFRVLVACKIAIIGRQDAVQEGLAVLTAQLDIAGTVPAVSACLLPPAVQAAQDEALERVQGDRLALVTLCDFQFFGEIYDFFRRFDVEVVGKRGDFRRLQVVQVTLAGHFDGLTGDDPPLQHVDRVLCAAVGHASTLPFAYFRNLFSGFSSFAFGATRRQRPAIVRPKSVAPCRHCFHSLSCC